ETRRTAAQPSNGNFTSASYHTPHTPAGDGAQGKRPTSSPAPRRLTQNARRQHTKAAAQARRQQKIRPPVPGRRNGLGHAGHRLARPLENQTVPKPVSRQKPNAERRRALKLLAKSARGASFDRAGSRPRRPSGSSPAEASSRSPG